MNRMDELKTGRELWTQHREKLRAQFLYFEQNVVFGHRIRISPDVTLCDQMTAEAMLSSEAVEAAIEHFIDTDTWPEDLAGETSFYTYHRFFVGLMALDAMLGSPVSRIDDHSEAEAYFEQFGREPLILEQPCGSSPVSFRIPPPDPGDERAFFRWLLIALWKSLGPLWIYIFAGAFTARSTLRPDVG